jgi:outer membrane lipoprotein LolB
MRLAACTVALLAAGCASLPPPAAVEEWPARRLALQALDHWTLGGRMAVAAGDEGFSGGLRWRQDGQQTEIELRGPMGGRALSIHVAGEQLAVTDGDGEIVEGDDATRLLARHVGASLPIAELRFWVVGAPAPGIPHQETIGADQRLQLLEQSGWRVAYAAYRSAGGQALPARMEITNGDLRLRLVVSDWRLDR